jgi:hypothetical protein
VTDLPPFRLYSSLNAQAESVAECNTEGEARAEAEKLLAAGEFDEVLIYQREDRPILGPTYFHLATLYAT